LICPRVGVLAPAVTVAVNVVIDVVAVVVVAMVPVVTARVVVVVVCAAAARLAKVTISTSTNKLPNRRRAGWKLWDRRKKADIEVMALET